ncbi:MAG TPA: glycosyltransferase [Actinocrinis sp.]|nr:glycosyltransferase [Actinocrinis sp.]
MHITVLAHGTRGDVYPLTALAAELARRGHDVRVGASANLVDVGRRLGLDTVPIAWDTQQALESSRGRVWADAADAESFVRLLHEIGAEHDERLNREIIEVCEGSDAIVSGVLLEWRAVAVAEAGKLPLVVQDCYPRRMNDVIPHPLMTIDAQLDVEAIRATYRSFARLSWARLREAVTRFRRGLGLPLLPSSVTRPLELQTYSPSLVPGLAWDSFRPFVGDLRMSRSDLGRLGMDGIDAELARWLDEGEPPALFTFGSTYVADPVERLAVIGRVCRSLDLRGLVVTGWGLSHQAVAESQNPDLRTVPYADYDVVLPRCALAVHHGGATITAAGVRAGIPTMICSASFDQPFWGAQLDRLGVGVHVRHAELTEESLRSGISRLMTEPVRRNAALLGGRLRAEPDGTPAAADEIEKYLVEVHGA